MIKWKCFLSALFLSTVWGTHGYAQEKLPEDEGDGRVLYLHASGGAAFLSRTGGGGEFLGYSFRVSAGAAFDTYKKVTVSGETVCRCCLDEGGGPKVLDDCKETLSRGDIQSEFGFGAVGSMVGGDIGGENPLILSHLGAEVYFTERLSSCDWGIRVSTSIGVTTTNQVSQFTDVGQNKQLVRDSVGIGWSGGVELVAPLSWPYGQLSVGILPIIAKSGPSLFLVVPLQLGISF